MLMIEGTTKTHWLTEVVRRALVGFTGLFFAATISWPLISSWSDNPPPSPAPASSTYSSSASTVVACSEALLCEAFDRLTGLRGVGCSASGMCGRFDFEVSEPVERRVVEADFVLGGLVAEERDSRHFSMLAECVELLETHKS